MRSTASGSIKQGLYAGSGALTGGVLGGPLGAMVGGIVGSVVGYYRSEPYDGVVAAVADLPSSSQDAIVREVGEILVSAGAMASMLAEQGGMLTALEEFVKQPAVRDQVWSAVVQGATLRE